MNIDLPADKSADALKAQRFQMLEDIARELSGDVNFPTCFDVAIHVRNALRDPDVSLDQIARVVSIEPLLCAKMLRIANSATYNPTGRRILDVKTAIGRMGLEYSRITALGVAMDQLMRSKALVAFGAIARNLWEHSLMTAVAAKVIAREMTQINPDEAMLAGLLHDLGAFYMLYRAAQYPELCARPDTVVYLIIQWHESIGESLMAALGLPEQIIHAICDHDNPRPVVESPRTLSDLVFVANLMANGSFEWQRKDLGPAAVRPELENGKYLALMDEIRVEYEALMGPLPPPA